jgi:hypothetical protein
MAMSPVLFVTCFTSFVSSTARSADVTNIAGLGMVRRLLAVLLRRSVAFRNNSARLEWDG